MILLTCLIYHIQSIITTFINFATILDLKMNYFPPSPPCEEEKNSIQTQPEFEYLSINDREYVKDAYEVISKKELWGPFREALLSRGVNRESGFMFNQDPLYRSIMDEICSTTTGSLHSGFSVAYVMRQMEYIALNGEDGYKKYKTTK